MCISHFGIKKSYFINKIISRIIPGSPSRSLNLRRFIKLHGDPTAMFRPDFVSLRLFVAVARAQSLTKGALSVHLTLPAASKRISELERELGMPVFDRHPKGVDLTPVGEALLSHALRVFHVFDELDHDLDGFRHGSRGVVRLAANTSALTQFLPSDLQRFRVNNSKVSIELTEQVSDQILESVRVGRCDLGVYASNIDAGELLSLPYRSDELVLIVPGKHDLASCNSIAFEDIGQECEFLMFPLKSSLRRLVDQVAKRPVRQALEIDSFDSMCHMVAAGAGIGVLPKASAAPYIGKGLAAVALDDPWAKRELRIAVRSMESLSGCAMSLVEHLKGSYSESACRDGLTVKAVA